MNKINLVSKIFLFLTIYISFGCEENVSTEIDKDLIVVQGFVYANQPVKDIYLSEVLSLGAEDTLAPPIINAEVIIKKGNNNYSLISDDNREGFYYYSGNDLIINSGDEIFLEVNIDDRKITAQTTVPSKPTNLLLDSGTLPIPEFTPGSGRRPTDLESYNIKLTWDNSDNSYHYVTIDNIGQDPTFIDLNTGKFSSRFISEPSISSEYRVSFALITHLGEHRLILYKVNQEYVDLYESRDQDSRNLNEPLTNIENGLGVFSAFASDTVYFNAVKE